MPLTELEGCVLGLIRTAGKCTPYAVRAELLRSPSVHWSGSAGAIYPLIARLRRRGLLEAVGKVKDKRGTVEYRLTASGNSALVAWIAGPLEAWILSPPMDPLRTRLSFAAALPRRERRRLIEDALDELASHVADARDYCRRHLAEGNRWAYCTGRGAQLALEARIAWLHETLKST